MPRSRDSCSFVAAPNGRRYNPGLRTPRHRQRHDRVRGFSGSDAPKYSKLNALAGKPEAPSASGHRPFVGAAATVHRPIDSEDAGQRLDNFLIRICKGVPKSHLYRIVRSGEVRVNRGRVQPDYRLQAGDVVRIPPIRVAASTAPSPPVGREFPVLFEDEVLLAVDKPAGVAVHGGSGVSSGVIERLRSARPAQRFLELVHRLDRETSGVLVIAKKRAALVALQDQWRARRSDKRYLAIVAGRWPRQTRRLDYPLHKATGPNGERVVSVRADGQEAVTRVSGRHTLVLGGLGEFSLVDVHLETGRTHQIRIHLAEAGHPLLGETVYARGAAHPMLPAPRLMLHAEELGFEHPATGERLHFRRDPPADFAAVAAALRGPAHPSPKAGKHRPASRVGGRRTGGSR